MTWKVENGFVAISRVTGSYFNSLDAGGGSNIVGYTIPYNGIWGHLGWNHSKVLFTKV